MKNILVAITVMLASFILSYPVAADQAAIDWSDTSLAKLRTLPNITYTTANGVELKLDVYKPRQSDGPVPTVVYIHGGGWVGGSKEGAVLALLPYLSRGYAAVNVQYRLADVSRAPAAVEDTLCALRWVGLNAEEHGFDTSKLVLTGHSAGGHLSLITGMLPEDSDLTKHCPHSAVRLKEGTTPKVAAIINWFGITDVKDLIDGENEKTYAIKWLGSQLDRNAIADRVSPVHYVTKDLPPILTIHGDADAVVPYSHATQLHKFLDGKNVSNKLITVPGGGHGGFGDQYGELYNAIFEFIDQHM